MKKVLIIVYYWPPSGGAGVQRWMKLSKYLAKEGVETHVLTVDPEYASYMQTDDSLVDEVSPDVHVHRTKSFEPINIFARMAGKKNVPTAGFANIKKLSFKQKVINFIRSNLFIPDPRKGWNRYAIRKAKEVIATHNIETVITSSPPHSTQLIGHRLKKQLGIHWIADLRDPWTDIYYYHLLQHSFISRAIDRRKEKKVLLKSDVILTVSEGLVETFMQKSPKLKREKFKLLPNGYDPEDFAIDRKTRKAPEEKLAFSYTGTMSDQYKPEVFFDVIGQIPDVHFQLIGKTTGAIRQMVTDKGLEDRMYFIDPVPHGESIAYLKGSDALLLIIPDIPKSKGILTGKMFEYLASLKPILCIGPKDGDAAAIINRCTSGKVFHRDESEQIRAFIEDLISGKLPKPDEDEVRRFSREFQAKELVEGVLRTTRR